MNSGFIIPFFFFLYLIMPEYFALEVSSSLPLLTASRFLILILLLFVLFIDRGKLKIGIKDKAFNFFVLIMLVVNCIHLLDCFSDSVKTIFSILFEQWLLVVLIVRVLNTREKIENAITAMVWASLIVGVLGMVEAFTGINVFYYLTTTSRDMLQASHIRMGMLRAEGPLGHSVYFGTYCVCMLPFTLYLYETRKKGIYLTIALANIVGTLCSGARGQILVLAVTMIYIFIKKKSSIQFKYLKVILTTVPVIILIFLGVPYLKEILSNTMKSVMNALGFAYALNDYGTNATGWESRLWQLSGVLQLYKKNALLFGMGSGCHVRGLVQYLWDGVWRTLKTFDVGYIGIIMQYGIVGIVAYLRLLISKLKSTVKNSNKADIFNLYGIFALFYVAYMLNLLSTVGVESMLFCVIGINMAYAKNTCWLTNT